MSTSELVERDAAIHTLLQLWQAASRGIVLVSGEAGIGKTSLLRAAARQSGAPLWWGACDALQTPHPLGPWLDIARDAGAAFGRRLDGPRPALFDAVLAELRAAPIFVVIEDVHWADEASLDLLKFLGRRIAGTQALLAISFRDDALAAAHPLRRLIGELPPAALTRIELAPLSPEGVATLARRALRAPAALHAATQGNPFFVTELLRHGGAGPLPRSVQDLVLARYAALDADAQAVLRLSAIAPPAIERSLLEAVLAPPLAALEAALDAGLLRAEAGDRLAYRHELARVAIETALATPIARALHARLLQALEMRGAGIAPARLAHHAEHAGDVAAIVRHAPAAADAARARGAFREAAHHYLSALQHGGDAVDPAQRRRWLEGHAEACQRIDATGDALASRLALEAELAEDGPPAERALNLSRLAILHVHQTRNAEADACSRRAIELLEALAEAPASALATAYGTEAALRMLDRDCEHSVEWSRKAIAEARRCEDPPRLAGALSTLGTALLFVDYEAGCRQMEEVLQLAHGTEPMPTIAATALMNLGSASGELLRYDEATRWLRRAVAHAAEHELDSAHHYATAWLALCALHQGRWDEAAELAGELLPRVSGITRLMTLLALGRLRLRRGDPGVETALDEALALAGSAGTLQRIAPVRAARAEAAFARGDLAACAAEALSALPLAERHGHGPFIGELAFWAWRAGALDTAPAGAAAPFALQIERRWREAAEAWQRLACPYEQARALADGDEAAQRSALALFEQLGATPAAAVLRQRLRDAGARGLPRGARASTRDQPFGLTLRELEVLCLLCRGLRNAEIAVHLSRSVRTIDHHLAAIFGKLGVDNRAAAVRVAAGLDLQDGQARSAN